MPSQDAKPVKKEEVEVEDEDEDEEDEKPISQVRNKNNNNKKPTSSTAAATPKQKSKVKKEESIDDNLPLKKPNKPTPKSIKPKKEEDGSVKDDKKKVKKKKEEEKVKVKGEVKKRERKVYDLPGQKRDPPEERDPLRIFYETLYQQKPTSELAAIWMMESGLLPLNEAKKVHDKKLKSKGQKVTFPAKPTKTVKETKPVTVKKKVAPSTPNSSNNKKKTETSTASKQSKKRKAKSSEEDSSSEEDLEEEYSVSNKKVKKARAN